MAFGECVACGREVDEFDDGEPFAIVDGQLFCPDCISSDVVDEDEIFEVGEW